LKVEKHDAKASIPVDVAIETVAFCNLRCIMCPQKNLARERGAMSFELFKKIINEVAAESPTSRIWLALWRDDAAWR